MYIRRENGTIIILAVYVDDIIIASNDKQQRKAIQALLRQKFKIVDLGELHWCLQMRVTRDRPNGTIKLDQKPMVDAVLRKFNMHNSKPISTPSQVGLHLSKEMAPRNYEEEKQMERIPYRSAIGSLMYLALSTRPDIANAVNLVSRFVEDPGPLHWTAVKRILRYLKGTSNLGVVFERTKDSPQMPIVTGYSDSDWGGDVDGRKSTTGYVFQISNGPVSWKVKRQTTVALSSAEAEYMAAGAATQEAIWLRAILKELGFAQGDATLIYEDNQGCISMTLNSGYHARVKHIDIRHHFIKDAVERQQVVLAYLRTDDMIADILTKPTAPQRFARLRQRLLGRNETC
jgi:hypothetical protein